MKASEVEVIPWNSNTTTQDWQALLDHFGYVAIELHMPVEIPYYFIREGWEDCILKVVDTSSREEIDCQRRFFGNLSAYHFLGGHFYKVVAE